MIRVADRATDVVDCGPGRDTVFVEDHRPKRDELRGCEVVIPVPAEAGHDVGSTSNNVFGTRGNDVLLGTPGVDTMLGNDGDDVLDGGEGDDYVDGEDGDDVVHGGPGNDDVHGRKNDDEVYGDAGNDRVNGAYGNDLVDGGPGDDELIGSAGNDTLVGGEGDDRIEAIDDEVDRVSCGPGNDLALVDPIDVVDDTCETVRK